MSQAPADPEHDIVGIVATLAPPPGHELLGKIAGRLTRKRRIGGTHAFAGEAVAVGAGGETAGGIADDIERRRLGNPAAGAVRGSPGHRGIISRDLLPVVRRELARDRLHLGMLPSTVRIAFELACEIADMKPGKPRSACAVAAPVQAVAGEAGARRAGIAAAQSNEFAVGGEAVGGGAFGSAATGEHRGEDEPRKSAPHGAGNQRAAALVPLRRARVRAPS